MRAGLLTEQIRLLRPINIVSGTGANQVTYDPAFRCRAYVQYTGGNRTNTNDEVFWVHNVIFTIRRFYNLDEKYRIEWKGRQYEILSIERKYNEQDITITTQLVNE